MSYLNIDPKKNQQTVKELNMLLADYHLYYQKLRNFHWNIIGKSFFDLHVKFEEMYNDSLIKIDEIAERILTLRSQPLSNYSDYLKLSEVKESPSSIDATEMVKILLSDHAILLQQLKAVNDAATAAEDEGTIDIMGGYTREIEKVSWMLDAYISTAHPKTGVDIKASKAPKKIKAKAAKTAKKKK